MKTFRSNIIIGMLLVLTLACASTKTIHGLWEVTEVEVGNEEMTPNAKWNLIHEDGSYTSGNGWLQNADGTWAYDKKNGLLMLTPITGFYDPYGSYQLSMEKGSTMTWVRDEKGQQVKITQKRIEGLPKSIADLTTGLWDVESAQRMGTDITEEYDPTNSRFMLLRWDHHFIDYTKDGQFTGVWMMDAKHPFLDILYDSKDKEKDQWEVTFDTNNKDRMILTKEGFGLILTFTRMKAFPG